MDRELGILGWSQAELARRLAVKPATVTNWKTRGLPRAAQAYLDAMVGVMEARDRLSAIVDRTRFERRGRGTGAATWEPSATDRPSDVPGADYVKKTDEWFEADLDQDSGEYTRG